MVDMVHGDLICTPNGYKTCDLYLAAFFSAAGCPVKTTSRDLKKVYFMFENTEMLKTLKDAYFLRQGKIDGLTYADTIKSLKSLCASILSNEIKKG